MILPKSAASKAVIHDERLHDRFGRFVQGWTRMCMTKRDDALRLLGNDQGMVGGFSHRIEAPPTVTLAQASYDRYSDGIGRLFAGLVSCLDIPVTMLPSTMTCRSASSASAAFFG